MTTAGSIVRYARLRAGMTQRDLGIAAGVAQPAIARIEAGRVRPRLDTVDQLLRACGMGLGVEPRLGQGVDRSAIRELLRLTPRQRLELAAAEVTNLGALAP